MTEGAVGIRNVSYFTQAGISIQKRIQHFVRKGIERRYVSLATLTGKKMRLAFPIFVL